MRGTETGIAGTCAPGYEPVRDAFAQNFAQRDEIGASVAVVVSGEPVVNLWAGWADQACTLPWREDTLTNVWSSTKAMTSLCAHILIDRGELDPDAPVARYWPEFAAAGKQDILVRWMMSHRAGLSGLTESDQRRGLLRLGEDHLSARGAGATVDTGHRQRLSRDDVGLPGR